MKRTLLLPAVLTLIMAAATSLSAATPSIISYQGRITDALGNALTGNYSLTFNIYDVAVGGTALWTETLNPVVVDEGLFNVLLGSVTPFNEKAFSNAERFIGVQVNGGAELSPRRQVVAVAYAFTSIKADSTTWSGITGIPADFADGVDNVGGVGDITAVNTSGGLTGGATTGAANISIASGGVTSTHIGDGQIFNADINAAAGIDAAKINGTAATLGGNNLFAATNQFDGTLRVCDSTMRVDCNGISIGRNFTPSSNFLVYARRDLNTAATRYGLMADLRNSGTGWVYGSYSQARSSTAGEANTGRVFGSYSLSESDNDFRFGSYSTTSATTSSLSTGDSYGSYCTAYDGLNSHGVYGLGTSANYGYGLYGEATNNTFGGFGVYGESHSNGYGVAIRGWSHGYPITSISYGVYGSSTQSGHGIGIYGEAEDNSGNGTAIHGYANNNGGDNWGGYFVGDVNVTGTIFTPVFVTRLDHPLDPENSYLQFSGVDSPEMTSVISGNVVTDQLGNSEVAVPGYFVAIASNPRYQLTVIGDFAQAIVSRELDGSGFAIRTDKPNIKVSWQITVTRQDAFANRYRVPTEVAKTGDEVGTYRFPEAFGQPESRGYDYIQWLQTKAITDAEKKRSSTAGAAVSEQEIDPAGQQ